MTTNLPSSDRSSDPVADLLHILDLQEVGTADLNATFAEGDAWAELGHSEAEIFVGASEPQPHGRIFGGQILAQCIIAAGRTVADSVEKPRFIHSLHGYFVRAGDASKPVRFAVERLRDGGSFSVRRVQAIQNGAPIMSMLMSFQEAQDGDINHQVDMPQVTPPQDLPTTADIVGDIDHPMAQHCAHDRAIDVRHVEGALYLQPAKDREPRQHLWMKTLTSVPEDPLLNAAILAYASDYTMLESAMRANGISWATPGYRAASLDHSMWFHRPVRVDDWILYDQESPSASGGRGLGVGRMFAADGTLVATVAQEGMMRLSHLDPSHQEK